MKRITLLLLLLASGGCIVPPGYRTVRFRVIDGDTGLPIPDASAGIHYEQEWFAIGKPSDRSAVAGKDAVVSLKIHPSAAGEYGWIAPGYVRHNARSALLKQLKLCTNGERQPCFIVPLYREPEPVVALALPQRFRGLIAVELTPTDLLRLEPGQRLFKIPISAGGYARIEGIPILTRIGSLDWTTVQPDGSIADPMDVRPEPVQFRWVHSVHEPPTGDPYRVHFFIVGTFEESNRAKRLLFDIEGEGTKNLFVESPAKRARVLEMLRSARSPVSVDEAERRLRK